MSFPILTKPSCCVCQFYRTLQCETSSSKCSSLQRSATFRESRTKYTNKCSTGRFCLTISRVTNINIYCCDSNPPQNVRHWDIQNGIFSGQEICPEVDNKTNGRTKGDMEKITERLWKLGAEVISEAFWAVIGAGVGVFVPMCSISVVARVRGRYEIANPWLRDSHLRYCAGLSVISVWFSWLYYGTTAYRERLVFCGAFNALQSFMLFLWCSREVWKKYDTTELYKKE